MKAMAIQQKTTGEMISETAKAEGGPEKGSEAAEMQSQNTKERNFEQAAQQVMSKAQRSPESISSEVKIPHF